MVLILLDCACWFVGFPVVGLQSNSTHGLRQNPLQQHQGVHTQVVPHHPLLSNHQARLRQAAASRLPLERAATGQARLEADRRGLQVQLALSILHLRIDLRTLGHLLLPYSLCLSTEQQASHLRGRNHQGARPQEETQRARGRGGSQRMIIPYLITLQTLPMPPTLPLIDKQNQMSDKKETIKIKEFEWYEVETKVREIMVDLLQPFNKKQTEESLKINEIKRNMAALQKKVEDHDFLLERENATKPTYIQLQDQKIQETLAHTKNSQLENEGKIKKMEAIVQIYEEKIKQLNDLQSRLDKEIIQRAEDFKQHKQGIDKQLQLMTKKQDAHSEEINQFKNITKAATTKMESRMISFDNRLRQLEDDTKHKASDIRKLLEEASNHNEKIIKLELKTINLTARVQDRERDSKLSEKFLGKVKEVQSDLRFLTTFLQQYQPLYTQMHISQTLNSFIQGKQRRKLCLYEQQRFARLHHHILMNQRISLEEMMSTFTHNIRKIVNRNKKYIINLAVNDSVKYGANVYEFRTEDPNEQEEHEERKQSQNFTFPEEEVGRVVAEKIGAMSNEIKKIMEEEIKPTKTWMKELQEQLLMRSMEYDNKYEELKKGMMENEAKYELEEKHVQLTLAQLKNKQGQVDNAITHFRDHVKDILNFSSVINHIVIQDQIDRQGTALYALKSSKNAEIAQTPTLQLDPNCVSCDNKNTPIIQHAFKMACLTYNPSQIRIDDQLFSREEILEISTGILEKLKKKLWNSETTKLQASLNTHQTIDRDRQSKRTTLHDKTPRKSSLLLKQASLTSRQSSRSKQLQTLLPILGASRAERRERKPQLSVFY